MSQFNREVVPPAALEDRVVAALWSRGLLTPAHRRSRVALAAAAAMMLVAAGYGVGRWQAVSVPGPVPSGPEFMLLLHETPAMASSGAPGQELVEQYRRWAQQVYADGHAIRGEKLKDVPGQSLGGFFIVQAPSLEAAQAIANSCPHAQRGGRIEIREIDPT